MSGYLIPSSLVLSKQNQRGKAGPLHRFPEIE